MRKWSVLFLALMLCLAFPLAQAQTEGDFAYTVRGGSAVITAYTGSAAHLIVPDMLDGYPVTAISYCAFRNCTSLLHVTLPDGILTIGSNAFQNCTALMQIDLPASLVTIGTHAFYRCANLTQITLPESIERLQGYSFYGCSAVRLCDPYGHAALTLSAFGYPFASPDNPQLSLMVYEDDTGRRTFTVTDCAKSAVRINLPDGVTKIEGYAFSNCASLTEIVIPEGVTEIAYSAFEGCSALTQVVIPASVVTIAENAFARCPAITIAAPQGSAAQAFAEANSFPWRPL
ncbi:MAG: leucine-rich repeat domain-containing protein [Clostridia bacterium]|nr:leucine-rich repeat domain-containing protein [Clostridia bacterium]